ncbi:MAG TPA: prephenate dehydratase domain-containing protein, partial [Lacipirellulaceae bacterium]|nr:prephenate dehydratase domain-containing protein [Lacipirellulaceae bacterium]
MAKKMPRGDKSPARRTARPSAAELAKLDRQIVALLNQRAELTRQRRAGDGGAADDMTSLAVLAAAAEANPGPLPARTVEAVFRELLGGIRAIDQPLRVAYLGPEFTYSHLAAIARFGQSAELAPVSTIAAVFEEVERGHAAYGVVPIENSTDGRVADALECFGRLGGAAAGSAAAGGGDAPARSEGP